MFLSILFTVGFEEANSQESIRTLIPASIFTRRVVSWTCLPIKWRLGSRDNKEEKSQYCLLGHRYSQKPEHTVQLPW